MNREGQDRDKRRGCEKGAGERDREPTTNYIFIPNHQTRCAAAVPPKCMTCPDPS